MDVIKQTKQTNKQEETTTYNTSKQSTGKMETCIWLILISAVLPLCFIRSGGW
jgi:hypothetical protein